MYSYSIENTQISDFVIPEKIIIMRITIDIKWFLKFLFVNSCQKSSKLMGSVLFWYLISFLGPPLTPYFLTISIVYVPVGYNHALPVFSVEQYSFKYIFFEHNRHKSRHIVPQKADNTQQLLFGISW